MIVVALLCLAAAGYGVWNAQSSATPHVTSTAAPKGPDTPDGRPFMAATKPPTAAAEPARLAELPAEAVPARPTLSVEGLLELTNGSRTQAGVPVVALSPALNASAQEKCRDMVRYDYFDHTSPSGIQPWTVIRKYMPYLAAGENLSAGYTSAAAVHDGWMNSLGHRATILRPSYDYVGFGICSGTDFDRFGTATVVVQHFVRAR